MLSTLFRELKRRKVFQVAAIYGVTAWVLLQIVVAVEAPLLLPEWVDTLVILLLGIGFPIALIMAWAFDLTPDGIVVTKSDPDSEPGSSGRLKIAAVGSLVLVGLAFGWLLLGSGDQENLKIASGAQAAVIDVSGPVPGFDGRLAIAVLPFVNISGDVEQEYFADGITEDIITALQAYGRFPVIARTSTFTYKGKNKDIREIARELGAGYVLEGSVRRGGDSVRITAQLIDWNGNHLWAQKFDRPLTDIFAVQDEITQRIVAEAEPEIMATEIRRTQRKRPSDLLAWDYYLRAVADTVVFLGYTDLNGRRVTIERNEKARVNAQKAIDLDPDFTAAYTLLAHIDGEYQRSLKSEVTEQFRQEAYDRAIANAVRARGIAPFDATACSCHAILLLMGDDVEGALNLQEDVVRLNPASAAVHSTLAKILHAKGDDLRALDEVKIAQRLSPRDMTLTRDLLFEAEILAGLERYEEAASVAHSAVLLSSTNYDAHVMRILSLHALGRAEDARLALKTLLQSVPDFAVEELWITPLPAVVLPDDAAERPEMTVWLQQVNDILVELGWQG